MKQGTLASRAHPDLDLLDVTGRQARTEASGEPIRQEDIPSSRVCLVLDSLDE